MATPGLTDFSTGLSVYGLPVTPGGVPPTTGTVFFVSNRSGDSGSDGNDGLSSSRAFSTLAKAVSLCSSGRGDVIVVMPGHAETITTTVTPIAGSAIVGLGFGEGRPIFTGSGAIAVFTVSAANVRFQNIKIVGASASVLSLIDISGNDFVAENVIMEQKATPLLAVRVTSTGARFLFRNCKWYGSAAGPDACIDLAKDSGNDGIVENCYALYKQSSGLDQAFMQGAAAQRPGTGIVINGLTVVAFDLTVVDFNSSTVAVGEGLIANVNAVASAGITLANGVDLGGYSCSNVYIADAANVKGTALPATTAS